ncbi:MAG TPA: hypothetical protein VN734_17065 [Acidobacteriaceae bacterium]|nr:hypothetical protein [Acidobacteriaceae bacterium]
MPSVSGKQHRFFGFLKSHPEAAKARGVSMGVVSEFLDADRGRHFGPPALPQRKPAFMRPRHG